MICDPTKGFLDRQTKKHCPRERRRINTGGKKAEQPHEVAFYELFKFRLGENKKFWVDGVVKNKIKRLFMELIGICGGMLWSLIRKYCFDPHNI